MCGIAGWVQTTTGNDKHRENNRIVISRIINRQIHRGPDDNNIWSCAEAPVILGHNRLAILDLTDSGSQPMLDSSSRWVISYNGELYNYKQLRQTLEKKFGINFSGTSDTEVFLYGVINFGVDEFLRMADGMFAASLYDREEKTLYLMRDRAGEKPLYYHTDAKTGNFYFASELKPLARSIKNNIKLDKTGLALYLMLRYVPAPYTILNGFRKLQPGHYMKLNLLNFEERQVPYYSWDPHASEVPPAKQNYEQVVKATLKYLVQSLETRLMSDVPLGFFLSGGVDSTLCAALIRKFFGKEINTYTIGFEGDTTSEHPISEKTASIIGSKHSTKIFRVDDIDERSLHLIKNLDEPNGDRSCVPTLLLCEHARKEVKVALGGDGGDELFGGYSRYPGLNKKLDPGRFHSAKECLDAYLNCGLPVFGSKSLYSFSGGEKLTNSFLESLAVNLYPPTNVEQAIRFVDFKSYLPGAVLAKVDRVAMQVSLEVRTPFFTPNLLDLSSRLPHEFLYRGNEMKPILRDICRSIGLQHVADLPKKGFGMPAQFLNMQKEKLISRAGRALTFLNNSEAVSQVIPDLGKKLSSHAGANMNSLWATIVLGEWFDHLTDK